MVIEVNFTKEEEGIILSKNVSIRLKGKNKQKRRLKGKGNGNGSRGVIKKQLVS